MSDNEKPGRGESSSDREQKILNICKALFSMGIAAGALVNAESIRWYQEPVQSPADQKDDLRPPKPPRRPNARVDGKIALGHGF